MTSLDFRLTEINETKNFLSGKIKHNDLTSEKHKKVCRALNYFEHFLVSIYAVSGCASIFSFASLLRVPVGIASSAVGLRICAITAEAKKYISQLSRKGGKNMIK